ncbi:hypothetical protein N7582_005498 [Saccharomyces uvarum]|uniref:Uncharacterized protein n=1 Tax=Saccharomyces uvarum TaxID=230603 RepID=A0AA35J8C6_SACUV|nr:hypothetical protein N7582_005498 [Saccharomyces uvarum]CAI4052563.1 hypothetical protein SUVC_16G0660 [Saccharomyces uvarum]
MVLLNRKEVQLDGKELSIDTTDRNTWEIKETGERIIGYDNYLKRLEFYGKEIFTCEVTGRNFISYFRALKSEEEQRKNVESLLSKELREAIANFVNFNSTRKISALVDKTYRRFSSRFFNGEIVCLKNFQKQKSVLPDPEEEIQSGSQDTHIDNTLFVVRDVFPSKEIVDNETGESSAPILSLHIITEYPNEKPRGRASIARQDQIERPTSHFSKFLLTCFLNETLIKVSNKKYAPWRVRQEYVKTYKVNPACPPEMVSYLPDELETATCKLYTPLTIPPEEDVEPETSPSKMRKISCEISTKFHDIYGTATSIGHNSLQPILDDRYLPFTGPSTPFESIRYLDSSLEYKTADTQWYRECAQFSTERLLVVYQFLNSFGPFIGITHFNFDELLTSIKCNDPEILVDEFVKITLANVNNAENTKRVKKSRSDKYGRETEGNICHQETAFRHPNGSHILPSNFTRNQHVRKFITDKSTDSLKYSIFKGHSVENDVIDVSPYNRAANLYVEIVCSLLCLVMDNRGDWTCNVMEEWIEEKGGKGEKGKSIVDPIIEECLNYKKINWTELLSNRKFEGGNWLICLLGVLQGTVHITTYTDITKRFTEKVVPPAINFDNMERELWQNFCKNLSTKDKIDILWVLVDMVSNFSSFVKQLVDEIPFLRDGIRSELDSIKKEYHISKEQLKSVSAELRWLYSSPLRVGYALKECEGKAYECEKKVSLLLKDISYLEAKLIESDFKRLEMLGKDRYGNRYYWMDSNGSPLFTGQTDHYHYNCCFLWVQGPSEDDATFYLNIDRASLRKWKSLAEISDCANATKEVFSIFRSSNEYFFRIGNGEDVMMVDSNGTLLLSTAPSHIHRKVIAETPEKLLLSPHQWFFFNDVEDIHMLVDRLDVLGENEHQLKKSLSSKMNRIEASYKQRSEAIRNIESDRATKKYYRLWKTNTFTSPELERIETMSTSNDKRSLSIEKLAKNLFSLHKDEITEKILKNAVSLGEYEKTFFEKRDRLLYPLDFHLEELSTFDDKLVLERKIEKQEDILTKLLNYRRHRHIDYTAHRRTNLQRPKEAAYLNAQDMLKDIKRHLVSRHGSSTVDDLKHDHRKYCFIDPNH